MIIRFMCAFAMCLTFWAPSVQAQQGDAADLAKQLSNPIASLISVPFQLNYDRGMGAADQGSRYTLNIQPVIPIDLNENWNLISRTIVPLTSQSDIVPGTSQDGMGDIVQSFFFSPKAPTANGLIWGAGPVFLLPTGGTGLGADQFAAGITAVGLKQSGPWTYGALANHLWDVGGGSTDISSTFFQPFVSYTTPDAWTFTLNSETTYDWVNEDTSLPVNFVVSKLTKIGKQPVSVGLGARYWVDSTTNGPEGWAARFILTFLYPR